MAFREAANERTRFAREQRRIQSRCEEMLWRELRGRKLKGWKFRRQAPIGRYFADFYCDAARLIIEADGPAHDDADQLARDRTRDAWLKNQGFRVLRFQEDEILGAPDRVLERIAETLAHSKLE